MELEHAIDIDAPPPVVWAVTRDVERWPDWTPTVTSAQKVDDRPLDVGSVVRLLQPGLPEAKWVVTSLTAGERFTWETRVRGMLMVASHELTPIGTGTRNVLRLSMHGLVARLLWPLARRSIRGALERENEGLKRFCEALVTGSADSG